MLFFLFFFFFFAYYVVLLLTVYWNADLALFLRPDLGEEKNREQIWPGGVLLEIIILRAVIQLQSWNFADFDLYIGGETDKLRNLGFRQCKTIIMPLIPISCSSVSCCRRCLAVLSDAPSAPQFLVDVFSFVVHAEFEVGVLTPEEFRGEIFLGEDLEPLVVLVCHLHGKLFVIHRW